MSTFPRRRIAVGVFCAASLAAGAGTAIAAQASSNHPAPPLSAITRPGAPAHPPAIRPASGASAGVVPAVLATNASCGMSVTASLTLNGDLQCSGNGLTVTGTSVILNLNGHQISGNGSNTVYGGIIVNGAKATVENGVVSEFGYGVEVFGATATVTKIRSTYNNEGFYVAGASGKYTSNVASSNMLYGFYAFGNAMTFTSNHVLSNAYIGMFLPVTTGSVLTSNIVNGNGNVGLEDGGYGTKLTTNTANFNGSDGIYINDTTSVDGGGNLAHGDNTGAPPAEECFGIVCS